MSERPDITSKLSHLVEKRLTSRGMYWSPEVNFNKNANDNRRVDFVGFKRGVNAPDAVAVEMGTFAFYEVKSSMEDFTSGHGLTFYGDENYLVCRPELAQQLVEEYKVPYAVDAVLCPDKGWTRLYTKIDRSGRWHSHRQRSASEILWAIVQSHSEEAAK